MKRIILNTLCLWFLIGNTLAQNVAEDLNKVRINFLHAKQMGFEVEVYYYPTKESTGELLSKGRMRKSGGNYYSSFMKDKMIVDQNKGTVIIDENRKTITYFDAQEKVKQPQQLELPDSLFSQFKYKGKKGKIRKYEIKSAKLGTAISRMELHIDESHRLNKVIYYYNKNTEKVSYDAYKVEINYKNIVTSNISSNYFNINRYISFKNNKPYLTKQYANYKLLN